MENNVKKNLSTISYSYQERKEISQRIRELTKKEEYIQIFKIIQKDKNTKYTENSNGIWLDLKKLDNSTINKINNYLNKLSNAEELSDSVNSMEYVPYSNDDINFSSITNGPKFSNYEKSIIRRHRYGEDIIQNSSTDE